MKHYLALVHKDAESAFGVQFPDLPGVFSASDDENGIIQNALDALRLFAEDEALPDPSALADIVALHDVRQELANGAYLVSIPLIENDAEVVRANISIERGMLRAIDETAKARKTTRSAFLAEAAKKLIEA